MGKDSAARKKILETAARLFYQNGIRATGIDAVIEEAGVARMTLYHHFPSKEALVEAVLQEASESLGAAFIGIMSDPSLSPRDKILSLFDWRATSMTSPDFRGCPFINAVVENPEHESKARCAAVSHKEKITHGIARCVKEMGIENPCLLTDQLTLLLDGAAVRAQLGFGEAASTAAKDAAEKLIDSALATEGSRRQE